MVRVRRLLVGGGRLLVQLDRWTLQRRVFLYDLHFRALFQGLVLVFQLQDLALQLEAMLIFGSNHLLEPFILKHQELVGILRFFK